MSIDMNIMAIIRVIVREGSVHHSIPWNVVRFVCVNSEPSANVVNSWKKVKSVPGPFSGRHFSRSHSVDRVIVRVRFGGERIGKYRDSVDGLSLIV